MALPHVCIATLSMLQKGCLPGYVRGKTKPLDKHKLSIFILLKAFLFRQRFQLKYYPQGKTSINFKMNLSQMMLNILRLWFWFIYIYI